MRYASLKVVNWNLSKVTMEHSNPRQILLEIWKRYISLKNWVKTLKTLSKKKLVTLSFEKDVFFFVLLAMAWSWRRFGKLLREKKRVRRLCFFVAILFPRFWLLQQFHGTCSDKHILQLKGNWITFVLVVFSTL